MFKSIPSSTHSADSLACSIDTFTGLSSGIGFSLWPQAKCDSD